MNRFPQLSNRLLISTFIAVVLSMAASADPKSRVDFRAKLSLDQTSTDRTGQLGGFSSVVKNISPSVVSIYTTNRVRVPQIRMPDLFDDDFFRRFFGDEFDFRSKPPRQTPRPETPRREHKAHGLGSGVILTKDGYIMTNNHVVEGADDIKVQLSGDRKDYNAEVIGRDSASDIAVIKMNDL